MRKSSPRTRTASSWARSAPSTGRTASSILGIKKDFPAEADSIGKSYLQLGARFGHPDWPGGWVGFDLYKSKGRMKLEVRGKLGGLAAICIRTCNKKAGKKCWDKLGANLRKVVRMKF